MNSTRVGGLWLRTDASLNGRDIYYDPRRHRLAVQHDYAWLVDVGDLRLESEILHQLVDGSVRLVDAEDMLNVREIVGALRRRHASVTGFIRRRKRQRRTEGRRRVGKRP